MNNQPKSMKVTLLQLNSQHDKQQNLQMTEKLIMEAIRKDKPDLIALPEMFTYLGGTLDEKKHAAETFDVENPQVHEAYSLIQQLAINNNVFIHCGSVVENFNQHYFNTTVVFNPVGKEMARYRKINLFQNFAPNGINYDETNFFSAGEEVATYAINDVIVGCAICYDLRFGEVFKRLINRQIKMIVIPSAFTYLTGKAHWELLCRSRAIETQSFIIAPAQTGVYTENGIQKQSWGHSMVVDPWGNILLDAEENIGYFSTTLDFNFLEDVRNRLPVFKKVFAAKTNL